MVFSGASVGDGGALISYGWNVGGWQREEKIGRNGRLFCVVLESPDINVFACGCVAKLLLSTFSFFFAPVRRHPLFYDMLRFCCMTNYTLTFVYIVFFSEVRDREIFRT